MIKKTLLLLQILLTGLTLFAQPKGTLNTEIDEYVSIIQKQYNIPGLALAIVKNGTVVHKKYYGVANIEFSVPVNDSTVFPLFSTTKIFTVTAIHQLIEQRKLSLDNSVSDFLIDLPETWKNIKIQNLLTHSSGLPDIVAYETENDEQIAKAKIYKDPIKFVAGNQFDYNQTNFWLLRLILEKITGEPIEDYIVKSQFPESKGEVFFMENTLKVVKNMSYGYVIREDESSVYKRNWSFPKYIYGAAALNMTLNNFINWNKKFDADILISKATKKQLLTPFHYTQKHDFCYGLELINSNGEVSYGFSGGVSTAFRKFQDKNITIILLANGMFIPNENLGGINEVINKVKEISEK